MAKREGGVAVSAAMRPLVDVSRCLAALVFLIGSGLGSGCTLIVLQDIATTSCEAVGDCAAGQACSEGACAAVNGAATPPPSGTPVGPAGGFVEGPDGVTMEFGEGATDRELRVRIARASSTIVPVGVIERSRFYTIEPAAELVEDAFITIPLDDACPLCAVWLAPEQSDDNEPWIELPSTVAGGTEVTGELPVLGVVVTVGEAS